MISLPHLVFAAAALLLLLASGPSAAQQPMNMPETKSAAPYHPGLGELMTAFVQPRHIKLGLAGNARNWPYAAYELTNWPRPLLTSASSCRHTTICRSRR